MRTQSRLGHAGGSGADDAVGVLHSHIFQRPNTPVTTHTLCNPGDTTVKIPPSHNCEFAQVNVDIVRVSFSYPYWDNHPSGSDLAPLGLLQRWLETSLEPALVTPIEADIIVYKEPSEAEVELERRAAQDKAEGARRHPDPDRKGKAESSLFGALAVQEDSNI